MSDRHNRAATDIIDAEAAPAVKVIGAPKVGVGIVGDTQAERGRGQKSARPAQCDHQHGERDGPGAALTASLKGISPSLWIGDE